MAAGLISLAVTTPPPNVLFPLILHHDGCSLIPPVNHFFPVVGGYRLQHIDPVLPFFGELVPVDGPVKTVNPGDRPPLAIQSDRLVDREVDHDALSASEHLAHDKKVASG